MIMLSNRKKQRAYEKGRKKDRQGSTEYETWRTNAGWNSYAERIKASR